MKSPTHPNIPFQITIAPDKTLAELEVSLIFAPDSPKLGEPATAGESLFLQDHGKSRLVVSLGKQEKINQETYRKVGGSIGKWLINHPVQSVELSVPWLYEENNLDSLYALLEGILLGGYQFQRYKQNNEPEKVISVFLRTDSMSVKDLVERLNIVTRAVYLARDWAHEPANVINPVTLAEWTQSLAEENELTCKILDDQALSKLGAEGILSVGKGSHTPPRMIILEYRGGLSDTPPLILIGKAITFDTGGYSLKDTTNIQGMKYDKCGGIAVIATILATALLKLPINVVGIVGAAENMISSTAYRPDDILKTLSGKTVEIISTDAEGRLVLADALTYAQTHYTPRAIIDLATLTGGVIVALGRVFGGVMGNSPSLIQNLIESGEASGERLWQLPLDEEYLQALKGDDADLKNSGGREGHAILGGMFLKQFVDDSIPWAHLDIAGVANTPKDLPYSPKGPTGFGVRLLIEFLKKFSI